MTDPTTAAALPAPEVRIADIVLPNQTNNHGTMFGGDVLALMDRAPGSPRCAFAAGSS